MFNPGGVFDTWINDRTADNIRALYSGNEPLREYIVNVLYEHKGHMYEI